MTAVAFTTKRKLNKAVQVALEDRKIPTSPFTLYRDRNDIGLIWHDLNQSAPIHARTDGTIYVGYATPFEVGSPFHRGLTGFEVLK